MALFEVMTALSVSLAIAIPTFMDKVMRPKYEGRFSEFRKVRREDFFDEFEDAYRQLKQAKEEMTPETIETMERLFNDWGQIKTDENKLTSLLKLRKFYFIAWLISCVLSLVSIENSETMIPYTNDNLGTFAMLGFLFMLFFSGVYCIELFLFDEKLSEFKAKTTGETFGKVESARITVTSILKTIDRVENVLKKFKIPYYKDALLKTNGGGSYVDFAIPTTKNPKYLIEIKARLFHQALYNTSLKYKEIKSQIQVKTILISNFRDASPDLLKLAQAYWDFVVDFQDLEKLREIIEL